MDRRAFRVAGIRALLLATAVLAAVTGHGIVLADHGDADEEPVPIQLGSNTAIPSKPIYPKLDSHLNRMVTRLGRSGPQAVEEMLYSEDSVAVTVRVSDLASTTAGFLEAAGATAVNVGTDYVEVHLPVTLLVPLAQRAEVLRVDTIVPPQADVTSQGASVHRSPIWNARGFTGAGVRVGIIDTGFDGFGSLMGAELPAMVVARCYTSVGIFTSNLSDCEVDGDHGTAVAESLIDIAPDVSLYIANVNSTGDLQSIASWMASQGVTVINQSLGWSWDGPGDGTSPSSDSPLATVAAATFAGIVWVNSAGNKAKDTWYGSFSDSDADGFHAFSGSDETNDITLVGGESVRIQLRWDDSWGGATRDLDLALYDSSLNLVASSESEQSGGASHTPFEFLSFTAAASGTYHVSVSRFGGSVPSWLQMQAFSGQNLQFTAGGRSIANPAESADPGLLAVGAANWATPSTIESFSSRGPTIDGRIKPDIVGADRAVTVSFGANGFPGTSQASPHVAGLVALVQQQFPSLTPTQVTGYLKSRALPRGDVPNNTWGFGFAQLPSLSPGPPTGVKAAAGDRQVTVSWSAPVADGGSAVTSYTATSHPSSITATVGGSTLTAVVGGLTNTTAYTFSVTAANGVGTSTPAAPSNSATPTGPPDPPTDATAVAGIGEASVTWSAPGSDGGSAVTGYTVTSNPGGLTATVGGSTLAATVTGLTKDTSYTFTVMASNAQGASASSSTSNAVTPANASPVAQPSGSLAVTEGATLNAQLASFTDTDASDVHTATVDWGDGDSTSGTVAQSAGSGTVRGSHLYSDDGTFAVTVTVSDGAGGLATTTVEVTASNVAPTVDAGPDLSGLGPGRVSVPPVTFTDPGPADTHTAVVDWGDGVVEAVPVDQQGREVELVHAYVSAGAYIIDVTVTDDDGGAGSDSLEIGVAVAPTTVNMPGVTSWGLLALAGVLASALVLRIWRRAAGSESWVPGG